MHLAIKAEKFLRPTHNIPRAESRSIPSVLKPSEITYSSVTSCAMKREKHCFKTISAFLNICMIFDRETRQTLFQEKGKI